MNAERCLINQTSCGRVAGNPVCPKCGMDERVVYPGQADREAAQTAAQGRFAAAERQAKEANLTSPGRPMSIPGSPVTSRATFHFDISKAIGAATALTLLGGLMWWKSEKENELPQRELGSTTAIQQQAAVPTASLEYRVRHILVEGETEAKSIIAAIQAGARFEDLAKVHSKDPGSRSLGGDLNWADPKVYVVEFERGVRSLDKGQVSKVPVQTVFGWHVIRVDDVREVDQSASKK